MEADSKASWANSSSSSSSWLFLLFGKKSLGGGGLFGGRPTDGCGSLPNTTNSLTNESTVIGSSSKRDFGANSGLAAVESPSST